MRDGSNWQNEERSEWRLATESPAEGARLMGRAQYKAGWCLAWYIYQADVWENWQNMAPEGLAVSFRDSLTQGLEVSLEVFHGASRQETRKEGQDLNPVNGTKIQLEHMKWARVMLEPGHQHKWWGWPSDLLTKGPLISSANSQTAPRA